MTTTHLLHVNIHHGQHNVTAVAPLDLETYRPTHDEITEEIALAIGRAREIDGIGNYIPDDAGKVRTIAGILAETGETSHGWARFTITEH